MKTAILLTSFQRTCKSAMYVCSRCKFLLAPRSELAKLTNASAECFAESLQFLTEGVQFTLRFAHLPKSEGFKIRSLHFQKRQPIYIIRGALMKTIVLGSLPGLPDALSG